MILIFGGAFNGKLEYAINNLNITRNEFINGKNSNINDIKNAKGIYNLHLLIKNMVNEGIQDISEKIYNKVISSNVEVIISDEIGMGIIPIEKSDRILREENGKLLCKLNEISEKTIRVIYGIPQIIKN